MRPGTKRALSLLALLALALLVVFITLSRPVPYVNQLPNPNGYDDLLAAARDIKGDPVAENADLDRMRAWVQLNTNLFSLVETGLARQIAVPLLPNDQSAQHQSRLNHLSDLKKLARLLKASGQIAESTQNADEALLRYVQLLKVGKGAMNNGLLIDALLGVAVGQMGLNTLTGLQPKLTPDQSQELARELRVVLGGHETSDTLVAREKAWARNTFGIKYYFALLTQGKAMRAAGNSLRSKLDPHLEGIKTLLSKAEAAGSTPADQPPAGPR